MHRLYREIENNLLAWKEQSYKKPLVLKGARQVGKTISLLHFGQKYYTDKGHNFHYIDFREEKNVYSIFKETYNPKEIVKYLQFEKKISINPSDDLVIFDEIQECPEAISALKYFEQDMNELDIIAAGSHLGLQKDDISFPVGKVSFQYMYPMTYLEFIKAIDNDAFSELSEYNMTTPIPTVVHKRLCNLFLIYLFTGGMPEVVAKYLGTNSDIPECIRSVRQIQSDLITGYLADFTKYSGVVNALHIKNVFESIPVQLSKVHDNSVSKYQFKGVIPKRKGFESISGPLTWLTEARLCIKNDIVKRANHPLKSYCNRNRFKLFLFDIGLLNCMLSIPAEVIIRQRLGPYKGFIIENYVAQELFAQLNDSLFSWQEGTAEVEFLYVSGADIIPVEAKSAERSRKTKSLDAFINRYNPLLAYKLTMQNYGYNPVRKITTLPLYCAGKLIQT